MKIMLITLFLVAVASGVFAISAPILGFHVASNSLPTFDFRTLLLDGNFTTNGGGDPIPGGGIPR